MPDHFLAVKSDVLTGLRAAANVSIVFCHAALCLAWAVGAPTWYKVTAEGKLASILIGFPAVIGVNTFLTLTAYLAAAQLIRRLQATDKPAQVIWEYYVRRLQRIVPAFYLLLVVHALMHAWECSGKRNNNSEAHELAINLYGNCGDLRWLPTQFLFLNHVLPDWRQLPWTWTLKLQMAFYVVFPWLLVGLKPKTAGFRRRLATAAVLFGLAGIIWRVVAVPLAGLRTPFHNLAISNAGKSAVHSSEVVVNVDKFLYWSWIAFVARGPDLATGVLLYLWFEGLYEDSLSFLRNLSWFTPTAAVSDRRVEQRREEPEAVDTHQQPEAEHTQRLQTASDTGSPSISAEDDEDEETCGFCIFMKGGGCKNEFTAWSSCVDSEREAGHDFTEECYEKTTQLQSCMLAHKDYYQDLLYEQQADSPSGSGASGGGGSGPVAEIAEAGPPNAGTIEGKAIDAMHQKAAESEKKGDAPKAEGKEKDNKAPKPDSDSKDKDSKEAGSKDSKDSKEAQPKPDKGGDKDSKDGADKKPEGQDKPQKDADSSKGDDKKAAESSKGDDKKDADSSKGDDNKDDDKKQGDDEKGDSGKQGDDSKSHKDSGKSQTEKQKDKMPEKDKQEGHGRKPGETAPSKNLQAGQKKAEKESSGGDDKDESAGDKDESADSKDDSSADSKDDASADSKDDSSGDSGGDDEDEEEAEETRPEITVKTVGYDARFPGMNQARTCYTRYNEYHRCKAEKSEDDDECKFYQRAYRSLCPGDWVDEWNEAREAGTWYGRY
ncbi:hypothetical protein WJX73_009474 [Symbiochloris irregularis]|uniref:GCK domain-containing protein n=1 Tax=Symbiochloris irregularis TaxID=706552 RepID=A0AAW1PV00_9CHLO